MAPPTPATARSIQASATYYIDDETGLAGLGQALDAAIAAGEPVAFDCEWRPSGLREQQQQEDEEQEEVKQEKGSRRRRRRRSSSSRKVPRWTMQ